MPVEPIVATDVASVRQILTEVGSYFPLDEVAGTAEIAFFGGITREVRTVGDGTPVEFNILYRNLGWAVSLTRTTNSQFLLLAQPKPGLLAASLEFAAGGIGRNPDHRLPTTEEILERTSKHVLSETGYAGCAQYLGFSLIETGKMCDISVPETDLEPGVGRGVKAHLVFTDQANYVQEATPPPTDIIQPLLVSRELLFALVEENVLVETSAVNCFALAMMRGLI